MMTYTQFLTKTARKSKANRRHWSAADFVVTSTSPAYDGGSGVNRFGYCRQCKADMQQFAGDNNPRHYASHGAAKRAGVWP